jgi:aspartate/methionine/tyrosine aminotransferase
MSLAEMEGIVKFCEKNELVLVAAEKNQSNVFNGKWHSFRNVINRMGSQLELFSFTSVSRAPFYL